MATSTIKSITPANIGTMKAQDSYSSLFPGMVYNLSSNIIQIAGTFTGNGSDTMTLGIPACTGTVLTRNTSNGKLELQYIHDGIIDTWDGVGGRVFDNGVIYQISGICSLD